MNLETSNKLHQIINSLLDKGEITPEGADNLAIVIDSACGIKGWIEAAEKDSVKDNAICPVCKNGHHVDNPEHHYMICSDECAEAYT